MLAADFGGAEFEGGGVGAAIGIAPLCHACSLAQLPHFLPAGFGNVEIGFEAVGFIVAIDFNIAEFAAVLEPCVGHLAFGIP